MRHGCDKADRCVFDRACPHYALNCEFTAVELSHQAVRALYRVYQLAADEARGATMDAALTEVEPYESELREALGL